MDGNYQEEIKQSKYYENMIEVYADGCRFFGYENVIDAYEKHIIPANFREETLNRFSDFYYWCRTRCPGFSSGMLRDYVIPLAGFTVIDKQLAQDFETWLDGRKVLEVMSGIGCLAYALQEFGVDIKATDTYDDEYLFNYKEPWVNIEQIGCIEAVEKYGADYDILLCSWPRGYYPMVELIDKMREVNPDMIMVYIGEGHGGCCADYTFFNYAKLVDELPPIKLKSYAGINDTIMIFK